MNLYFPFAITHVCDRGYHFRRKIELVGGNLSIIHDTCQIFLLLKAFVDFPANKTQPRVGLDLPVIGAEMNQTPISSCPTDQ